MRSMEVTIEPCDPFADLDAVYEVLCLAQGADGPRQRAWRDEHLARHTTRADFDFLVARQATASSPASSTATRAPTGSGGPTASRPP